MVKTKKFAAIMSASLLALTMLAPTAGAQGTPIHDGVQIQIANVDINVSKETLIKKFKALFPGKFNYLTNNDFQLNNTGHYYHNDPTVRYELSFNKQVNNKMVYGHITFAGDEYEIEQFYYTPTETKEALFPAKVSKDEALNIAEKFVNKLPGGKTYKLQETFNYSSHTTLTEPIQYSFAFARLHNGIPLGDQYVHVTVLGNGEITNLSQPMMMKKDVTYDQETNVQSKEEMLEKYKQALSVDLQYSFNYLPNQPAGELTLIYRTNPNILGIQAATGKWQTATDFATNVPEVKKAKPIVAAPLQVNAQPLTIEDAKKKAEELLKIDDKNVKLVIHSAEEQERNGMTVIYVHYMYESRFSGFGGGLEFNKATGEIIQYHNSRNDLEEASDKAPKLLSESAAKNYALDALKEFTPSVLHEYSEPIDMPYIDYERGTYSFTFPKLINGIPSSAHSISVGINHKGELQYLYNSEFEVKSIPSPDDVVSETAAKKAYTDALDLELRYVRHGVNQNHYHLVYVPVFGKESYSFVDAKTGELQNTLGKKMTTPIEHPVAADQLNYLAETGILKVTDVEKFNADAKVTKGEALEILVKSLSYFYYGMYGQEGSPEQMINGVSPDDPYYPIVERAVMLGVLDSQDTFSTSATVTREEVAIWFIRLLGLQQAAEQSQIYKLSMTDAADITAENAGYVALAEALQLLPLNNNAFNPKAEMTYAELAVATFELAYEIADKNNQYYYR
ncbi:MAG: YcdB/YcdC domain-containing protein [Solibacillus sp.]